VDLLQMMDHGPRRAVTASSSSSRSHESARADAARALGVDPLDSQMRQVFFFDTPELCAERGGGGRSSARRQNEEGDTVVKLRPSSRITCPRTCAR
jgi:hypothetical protein